MTSPARPAAVQPGANDAAPASRTPAAAGRAWHGVEHYENFPVGSWLVPRRLRPAVVAIYRFARHADDIADEGDAAAAERDARLLALDRALLAAAAGRATGEPVVDRLAESARAHGLDWQHFHHLLDAFRQDLRVRRYADAAAVDDYCCRSANPVGRLMLELFGAATPENLAASDRICSGLQRVNFLQDIALDLAKDRVYLPAATLAQCGVDDARLEAEVAAGSFSQATRRAVAVEAARARGQLLAGRVLVDRVPRRLGWELRFVLAGALRVLDRLAAIDHDVARERPRLGWRDAPALATGALRLARPALPPAEAER